MLHFRKHVSFCTYIIIQGKKRTVVFVSKLYIDWKIVKLVGLVGLGLENKTSSCKQVSDHVSLLRSETTYLLDVRPFPFLKLGSI